jgi:peptidoglycan/xylan/chitin deacetylase (PgdA/CDA1 family)
MTFDDGPHPTNTPRLLDMLRERGIRATFYLIGNRVVQ